MYKNLRISGSLNLTKLKNSIVKMKGEKGPIDCLVIPLAANDLTLNEKNQCVYLNFNAFASKNQEHSTHFIKASMAKKKYDKLSDEEKKTVPIIGNITVKEAGAFQDTANSAAVAATGEGGTMNVGSDVLPF